MLALGNRVGERPGPEKRTAGPGSLTTSRYQWMFGTWDADVKRGPSSGLGHGPRFTATVDAIRSGSLPYIW